MEVLVAINWTRWRVEVGASFCGRGMAVEGPKGGMWRSNVITKKRQKKATH